MNMLYTFFLLGWLPFLLCMVVRLRLLADVLIVRGWGFVPQTVSLTLLVYLMWSFNFPVLRQSNLFAVAKAFVRHTPQGYNA